MTYSDIVTEVARATKIKKSDVRRVMALVFSLIIANVAAGNSFNMRHFGLFKYTFLKSRIWKLPHTGELRDVGNCGKVTFKPSKGFKKALKDNKVNKYE